ncbi:MAG: hypothetical protein ACI89T_002450 [Cognaticolwellia sp.]
MSLANGRFARRCNLSEEFNAVRSTIGMLKFL